MNNLLVYAGYRNSDDRTKCSSGAIFLTLAKNILKNSGVVYGVSMTNDMYNVQYSRIEKVEDLDKIIGSKYMQAEIKDTFINVKRDLDNNVLVLFSGTPCQVNGLKTYLQKEYNKLICVDIVCHGVPSHILWEKYAKKREEKIGKIKNINFRSKQNGWYDYGILENNNYTKASKNSFMKIFLSDVALRPSCYNCKSKKVKKSDFTIGDFWGVDEICPEINDDKGVSIIIIRSKKALQVFKKIKNDLIYKKLDYLQAVKNNPSEYESINKPKGRDIFYKILELFGYNNTFRIFLIKDYFCKITYKLDCLLKRL